MDRCEIRLAQSGDAEGIQEVFYRSWLKTYPNADAGITREDVEERFTDRLSKEKLAQRRSSIENPPEGEVMLVAIKGGIVVGVCSPINKSDRNQLQRIYVLPEYERQGIGTQLWERAMHYIDTGKDTYVEVAIYNQNAINFYTKLGFRDTGRRDTHKNFRSKSGAELPILEMILKGV